MRALLAFVVIVMGAAACDGQGTFTPGGEGEGEGETGPTIADIGSTCTYHRDGVNPTKTCPKGLACVIVTSDNQYRYDSGLGLPLWEDQFTVYEDSDDLGYCTLQGTTSNPPACPAGSVLKVLSQNVTVCLKECTEPSDCSTHPGYTCDVRYDDTQGETCVHKCQFDIPDCVRSGEGQFASAGQAIVPFLLLDDLAGGSECGTDNGICGVADHTLGHAAPGEPCNKTSDCEVGSACIQGPVLFSALGAPSFLDQSGPGFCASPCNPTAQAGAAGACTDPFVCQSAGLLNLGFFDPNNNVPGPFVVDDQGNLDSRGGFCFHQCSAGVQADCDPFTGTKCDSLNESLVGDQWNGTSMCLPNQIAN